MAAAGRSRLYAVVPAGEALAAVASAAELGVIACGSIAGLAGTPRNEAAQLAAVRHDLIVGRALAACSSVLPFRIGADARSTAELRNLLAANEAALARELARLAGRAEMGLKVKLPSRAAIDRLPAGLAAIWALAPRPEDRCERLIPAAAGQVFEGCYLVSRSDIDAYWSGVGELRTVLRGAPVLGSGPWAAYSFCNLVIRPDSGRGATDRVPQEPREVMACIRSRPSKVSSM